LKGKKREILGPLKKRKPNGGFLDTANRTSIKVRFLSNPPRLVGFCRPFGIGKLFPP